MNAPAQLTEAEQAYDIANKYQGDCRGHLTPDEQLLVCHQFVKLRALLAGERKPVEDSIDFLIRLGYNAWDDVKLHDELRKREQSLFLAPPDRRINPTREPT